MADKTPIASITNITGKAYARDEQGNVREVTEGDLLYDGEVLITSAGGSVDLATIDGEFVNIADAAETTMTTDLVASLAAGSDESELTGESIDDVLNLLAGDGDILEGLEATAAGVEAGGGEQEGHSFIRLGRIVEELNPLGLALPSDSRAIQEEETTRLEEVLPPDNSPPEVAGGTARVSEEGLAGGNIDNLPVGDDTTNLTVATGNVLATDPDGDTLTYSLTAPAPGAMAGGHPVIWTANGDSTLLTGSAGGVDVATMAIDISGKYTFTVLKPFDHPAAGEDVLNLVFGVSVSDGTNPPVAAAISIGIEDDSPLANDVLQLATTVTPVHNVVLVLDRSISMSFEIPDGEGGTTTKIAVLRDTLAKFLDQYDDKAALNIKIYSFNHKATAAPEWFDNIDDAIAYINGSNLEPTGGTSYKTVLERVAEDFTTGGSVLPPADLTSLYFVSDGYPRNDFIGTVDNKEQRNISSNYDIGEAAWEAFLASSGIDTVYSAGIGVGIDLNPNAPQAATIEPLLNQVSWVGPEPADDDDVGDRDETILVGKSIDLLAALLGTVKLVVSGMSAEGSLLSDLIVQPGADGAAIDSVTFLNQDGTPLATYQAVDGDLVDQATALGGTLTLNFATGDYSYTPALSAVGLVENFQFSVTDGDGDAVSFKLDIQIGSTSGIISGSDNAEVIFGTTGDDTLLGNGGDDTLVGGQGNDTLTGGLGADVFAWQLGDAGTAGAAAIDTIVDFNAGEDALDLSELLIDETAGNLGEFIFGEADVGASTVTLHISSVGGFTGDAAADAAKVDQSIVFEGIALTGGAADQDIINDLISSAKISTDV